MRGEEETGCLVKKAVWAWGKYRSAGKARVTCSGFISILVTNTSTRATEEGKVSSASPMSQQSQHWEPAAASHIRSKTVSLNLKRD